MFLSQSTAFPRHEKKEIWGTNNDETHATYENTNAQKKEEM